MRCRSTRRRIAVQIALELRKSLVTSSSSFGLPRLSQHSLARNEAARQLTSDSPAFDCRGLRFDALFVFVARQNPRKRGFRAHPAAGGSNLQAGGRRFEPVTAHCSTRRLAASQATPSSQVGNDSKRPRRRPGTRATGLSRTTAPTGTNPTAGRAARTPRSKRTGSSRTGPRARARAHRECLPLIVLRGAEKAVWSVKWSVPAPDA